MITRHHASKMLTEYQPHHFCVEASTLSTIVPAFKNSWPGTIQTEMGNGQPFIITSRKVVDDCLEYVNYRQDCGCLVLRVFND